MVLVRPPTNQNFWKNMQEKMRFVVCHVITYGTLIQFSLVEKVGLH